uniref:Candidate secreted effector n=1 Tax=Meloidogyne incognita TaxID=6306 RepID=A0A914M5W6_MELIC
MICLHYLVECGIIGLAGAPFEATWCAALGRESTHCPQGANSNPLAGGFGMLSG